MKHLKSREGYSIGYWNDEEGSADFTPLDYLLHSNPKTAVMPRGFRSMLTETSPRAAAELQRGGTVCGFKLLNIMEANFNNKDVKWNR